MEDLEVAMHELYNLNKNPIVICLSEHFIKRNEEKYLNINNFYLGAIYSRESQRRGGTCILCKKGYESTELHDLKQFAMEKHFEVCGLIIKQIKLIILFIYRTPNSDVNKFFENLTKMLLKFQTKKYNIIICGDFNIDLLTSDKTTSKFKEILLNYGMHYYINKPTRMNRCIDNIIGNIPNIKGETYNFCLSDHNTAQVITIDQQTGNQLGVGHYFKSTYDLNKVNVSKFVEYMSCISFNEIYDIPDTNAAFNNFHDFLTLMYNLCFPCIKVKVRLNSTAPKWITAGIRKSCNTKRLLRYKYYVNRNSGNKYKYKVYSKLLKKCMNNLKSLSNKRHIINSQNKVKATWNVVKCSMGNTANKEFITKIIDNNIKFTSGSDIANKFNNYFIDIANYNFSSNNSIQSSVAYSNTINLNNINDNSIFIQPTDSSEIYRVIMSLKNTKSAGYDNITTDLVKKIARYISSPLAHIINLSFEHGCFPDRLKLSLIKPLHKKGCKLDIDNYRPIALTPILSKIFERVMYERVLNFLNKYNTLVEQQFGFRKNKSTTLAIFTLVKSILNNLNSKVSSCALFLDLSKAFDLVDHVRLLKKMERYGIRGSVQNWFQSYLSNRKQVTRVVKFSDDNQILESYDSESRVNPCGVPQGSILGPLLFLLYINDLPQSIKHQSVLFADDTTVIINVNNNQNYDNVIRQALDGIINWLNINKLKLNISKTSILHFKTFKGKSANINVAYNNTNIKQVHSAKFLGVTLDEHLSWKNHTELISKKINQFVFALRKVKDVTSRQTALMVYHAYVCSIIRYGIVVWGNSTEIDRIFIAQKKCIRAIFSMQWSDSCRPIFKSQNLLTVPCMYIYEIARFLRCNSTLFDRKNNSGKRKATHLDFEMPVPRLELFRRSCVYMGPLIYNSIPKFITQLPFNKFCTVLRKWLLHESFYSIEEFFHKYPCKFYTYKRALKYK